MYSCMIVYIYREGNHELVAQDSYLDSHLDFLAVNISNHIKHYMLENLASPLLMLVTVRQQHFLLWDKN